MDDFRSHQLVSVQAVDKHKWREERVPQNAIRGFGGRTTLCPVHFFASGEVILPTVLLVVLKLDTEAITCVWRDVKLDSGNMTLGISISFGRSCARV